MPRIESNNLIQTCCSSTICLLLCFVMWCSCPMIFVNAIEDMDRENNMNHKGIKSSPDEGLFPFGAQKSESRYWHPWHELDSNLPILWSLFRLPLQYKPSDVRPKSNRPSKPVLHILNSQDFTIKANDDDEWRNQRNGPNSRGKRVTLDEKDYRPLYSALPNLWPRVTSNQQIIDIPDELVSTRLSSGKKSETDAGENLYKDGFLGVRG